MARLVTRSALIKIVQRDVTAISPPPIPCNPPGPSIYRRGLLDVARNATLMTIDYGSVITAINRRRAATSIAGAFEIEPAFHIITTNADHPYSTFSIHLNGRRLTVHRSRSLYDFPPYHLAQKAAYKRKADLYRSPRIKRAQVPRSRAGRAPFHHPTPFPTRPHCREATAAGEFRETIGTRKSEEWPEKLKTKVSEPILRSSRGWKRGGPGGGGGDGREAAILSVDGSSTNRRTEFLRLWTYRIYMFLNFQRSRPSTGVSFVFTSQYGDRRRESLVTWSSTAVRSSPARQKRGDYLSVLRSSRKAGIPRIFIALGAPPARGAPGERINYGTFQICQ